MVEPFRLPPSPPSPPLTPPGVTPYGPVWVHQAVDGVSILIVIAVTLCAVYVLVRFIADALATFPEARRAVRVEDAEENA